MEAATTPSALVVARNVDDRILLRALLRIHHVPVVGEADGAAQALPVLREQALTHMVLDSELADGDAASLVAEAQSIRPTLRIVLLTRGPAHISLPTEPGRAPVVQLVRPFRFGQFREALGTLPGPARPRPGDRSSAPPP